MVFEKGRLEKGALITRMMPLSWNTQRVRQLVDDLAYRLMTTYPNELKKLQEAVNAGKSSLVQKYEMQIAKSLLAQVNDTLELDEKDMYLENQVLNEIDEVAKKLEGIKAKPALKDIRPKIKAILDTIEGIRGSSKALYNRAGAMVTSSAMQTMSMKDQMDALRGLFTPMVLDGRAERNLTRVVIDFGKKVEKFAKETDYAIQSRKDIKDYIKKLDQELGDFHKYMDDEFKALLRLRMNSMIALLSVARYGNSAVQGLRKLLATGFPHETEENIEKEFGKFFAKLKDVQENLMWDEKYEDEKMVADTVKDVARLLQEINQSVK